MTLTPPAALADMTNLTPLAATTMCPDPHVVYRRLREQWGSVAPVQLEAPDIKAWLVLGYPELIQVARREELYSRNPHNWRDLAEGKVPPDSGLGPMMFPRDNAYFSDGAKHRRLRAPLEHGIANLGRISGSVTQICDDLIAGFADRGNADLVADYAAVIPMLAVAAWFGLDPRTGEELRQGLLALFGSGDDSQDGNRRFEQILLDVLHARQAVPADDLTTRFLQHPDMHDTTEVLQQMVVMVSAGYETTTVWIARTLLLMLTDPRFALRLHGGRLGIDEALDEVLLRDPPMSNMPARFALHDHDLAGHHIRRGDALVLGLAAANHDPILHTGNPWLDQGNRAHLAWSTGPHLCPAHDPARIITRVAVQTALNRLSEIRLTIAAEDVPLIPSPWTRGLASLPVTFAPVPTHLSSRAR
ncbi:cytochrome P450 [Actinoallomurus acanthiterrae]